MPEIMNVGDIAFPHLGIYLHNVVKSFDVFGFTIALYGCIIASGMLLAVLLISKMLPVNGLKSDYVWDSAVYIILFGLVGARLYYVAFSWEHYKDNLLSILNTRNGGLAIYGGVIAGLITLFLFCKIKKISPFSFGDAVMPGVLVGQIMGRWGNFTNREAFGQYTDGLFAMRLPIDAVRAGDISQSIEEHIVEGTNYIQVHPTFLYESLWNLVLMILLVLYTPKKKFKGQIMLLYFGGYGIGRYWIEGLRTDQLLVPGTTIPISQVVAIGMLMVCVVGHVIGMRFAAKKMIVEPTNEE